MGVISDEQFTEVCKILKKFPGRWQEIAIELGFRANELSAIRGRPLLLSDAPLSWMNTMLADWKQWTPTDARRSRCYPTLHSLRAAVDKAGLGTVAEGLGKLQRST